MVMQTDLALNNHHMQGVEYNKIFGVIRFYHSGSKPFNEKDLSSVHQTEKPNRPAAQANCPAKYTAAAC